MYRHAQALWCEEREHDRLPVSPVAPVHPAMGRPSKMVKLAAVCRGISCYRKYVCNTISTYVSPLCRPVLAGQVAQEWTPLLMLHLLSYKLLIAKGLSAYDTTSTPLTIHELVTTALQDVGKMFCKYIPQNTQQREPPGQHQKDSAKVLSAPTYNSVCSQHNSTSPQFQNVLFLVVLQFLAARNIWHYSCTINVHGIFYRQIHASAYGYNQERMSPAKRGEGASKTHVYCTGTCVEP